MSTFLEQSLLTWADVDAEIIRRREAGEWPTGMVSGSAYYDGLVVHLSDSSAQEAVSALLSKWFGARYQRNEGVILDAVPGTRRVLPVTFEVVEGDTREGAAFRPTFQRVAFYPYPEADGGPKSPPQLAPTVPPIFVFHSYKGGVGRTLHLAALLKALTERKPAARVLVVDADLEAPGLTHLCRADGTGSPPVSFVDLLVLAHGDRSESWQDTTRLVAHSLKSHPMAVRSEAGPVEHFFLPAFRGDAQQLRLDIRPEHLMHEGRPWAVTELIAALALELDVSAVLVDLRAGLSELAAPLLFDARCRRVLVTTPSLQSVEGTRLVLQQLRKVAPPREREDLSDPSTIVSFVTKELADSGRLSLTLDKLADAYEDPEDVGDPRLEVATTEFAQELLISNGLADLIERLSGKSALARMTQLSEAWLPTSRAPEVVAASSQREVDKHRDALASLASRLEFAESGEGVSFLRTPQLRALAQRFSDSPPLAVVVGSKGAGKTYTYLQLVRSKTWRSFVGSVLGGSINNGGGSIWPLLQPKNLEAQALGLVDECVKASRAELKLDGDAWSPTEASDALQSALGRLGKNESLWRQFWFGLIAKSLRIKVRPSQDASLALTESLRESGRRVTVVIDGLEERFAQASKNDTQKAALRALLQDVPSRLREIPDAPVGLVVFIRADLVNLAIPQNVGQFLRVYEAFALTWDEEQALRLAVWICAEASVPLAEPGRSPDKLTIEQATQALHPVWGRKLGSDRSREGRTAEWVLAALSDFRGQVQARDLVRLLRYAADKSKGSSQRDRVLVPTAVRNAIEPCSVAKIKEIEQENPILKSIFQKMQKIPDRRIPFELAQVRLTRTEIKLLELFGVVLEEEGQYYVPEIFRLGLGFQLAKGARPRVLRLARRANIQFA